jgi:preprotein translocase subunit SecE
MNPNRRWIALFFFLFGLLTWILTDKFVSTVMYWVGIERFNLHLLGERFTLTTLLGLITALTLTLWMYRHPTISNLSNEVVVELKKVTWPTAQETRSATLVVIITVFIMAFFLGIFDLFWSKLLNAMYPRPPAG